jgi:glycosyltransferase involved in cell wall biosynthesis
MLFNDHACYDKRPPTQGRRLVKLGIYCDSGINGGHEEMLKRYMRALIASADIDTLHVLVSTSNTTLYRYVEELAHLYPKIRVHGLSYTAESIHGDVIALARMTRSTAAMLRELKLSKLLIAQGTIASGLAGLFAARLAGVSVLTYLPLVDDAPVGAGSAGKVKWLVKRALYRMPDEYVTLNDHLSGKLKRLAPNTRTMVLENYVDDRFSLCTLTKESARAALGLPDDGTRIIAHIGRVNFQQKRQDFFMDAIERHADAFKGTLVLIVGEGADSPRLKARIDASPALSACVKMMGPQSDVLPYIVASDALVLPSAFEGVPLVMIEAVLAGRPIVVSQVSGLDAYLPPSLLFPADDPDALVERLFAAPQVPLDGLTHAFRRRFSREVFEAQAQHTMNAVRVPRSPSTHAQPEHSDAF